MTWTTRDQAGEHIGFGPAAFWLFVTGGIVFVLAFLAAGGASVPRRYAVHLPEWIAYDRVGSLGALLVVAGVTVMVLQFLVRLPALLHGTADALQGSPAE
jgi:cytochrome c oxidase subunit 1